MEVRIIPTTYAHCSALAEVLRAEDSAEIVSESGRDPIFVIARSVVHSGDSARTVFFNDEIAGIFGVVPVNLLCGIAVGWALTGCCVNRYPKTFVRVSKKIVKRMLTENEMIFNIVDARYEKALRWLRKLGFTIGEEFPHGPERVPFRYVFAKGG